MSLCRKKAKELTRPILSAWHIMIRMITWIILQQNISKKFITQTKRATIDSENVTTDELILFLILISLTSTLFCKKC